jgi:hypothetical protein
MRFNDGCDSCAMTTGLGSFDLAKIQTIDGYVDFGTTTEEDQLRQSRLDDATSLKSKLEFINTKLYDALPSFLRVSARSDLKPIVDAWHGRAVEWMNDMGGVAADNAAFRAWVTRGEKLKDQAEEINGSLKDWDVATGVKNFAAAAQDAVLKYPTKLAMAIGLPLIVLVGAVGIGLVILKKSGLSANVNIPGLPVSAGLKGFGSYWKKQSRRR